MSAILSSRMTEISTQGYGELVAGLPHSDNSLRKHDRSMESVQREAHGQAALAFI